MEYICENKEQLPYFYWLHHVDGIGNATIRRLLQEFETPENVYYASEKSLGKVLSFKRKENLIISKKDWKLKEKYQELEKMGIRMLPKFCKEYPFRLQNIVDAPEILYVMGDVPQEHKISVAMIGARNCSEYGRYVAREFTRYLVGAGVQIVSGMARGIDGISQEMAIEQGGKSFAVLGSGVDVCYPKENLPIYNVLKKQGGILSEYVPGTMPQSRNFPPRNRIISGLSDIIIVIEAREKSGTLITVDMALEQGKEVYMVPGRITDRLSDGCNRLMKQGAGIILSPADLMEEVEGYGERMGNYGIKSSSMKKTEISFANERERVVYEQLDIMPKPTEEIWNNMKNIIPDITMMDCMEILLSLMMKNIVMQVSGGQFIKIK